MLRIHAPAWKIRSGLAALAIGTAVSCLSLPASAQDAADLVVRTSRMENQIRQLSGQIEQLQFENRRLSEQLRKFQEDVEFRLNERGGGRAPAAAAPGGAAPAAGAQRPQRRSDAFDPSTQVGAAGAPRPLNGGIGGIIEEEFANDGSGQGPLDLQGVGRGGPGGALPQPAPRGASVAAGARNLLADLSAGRLSMVDSPAPGDPGTL